MYVYSGWREVARGWRVFLVLPHAPPSLLQSPSPSFSLVSFPSSLVVAHGTATSQKVITIMNVYFRNQLNRGR